MGVILPLCTNLYFVPTPTGNMSPTATACSILQELYSAIEPVVRAESM